MQIQYILSKYEINNILLKGVNHNSILLDGEISYISNDKQIDDISVVIIFTAKKVITDTISNN